MEQHFLASLRDAVSRSPIGAAKRAIFPPPPPLAQIPRPNISAADGMQNPKTLLLVVTGRFKQDAPAASTLTPLGFANGWAETNGPVRIVQDVSLMEELPKYDNPAISFSVYSMPNLPLADCRKLQAYDTFVWASIHPSKIPDFKKQWLLEPNQQDTKVWEESYKKIMELRPNFMWNSVGKRGMEWYEGWVADGLKWVTIHPAADTTHYFPEPAPQEYGRLKIAYVGGYWKEKAQAFDTYLKPLGKDFTPFGYAKWPYENYGGPLNMEQERRLYSSAGLIPLVTSPGGWLIAELTERYFKAPACKAFCIADENSAVREVFSPDEMLQAENAEHFHHLANEFLKGNIDVEKWKEAGYKAVMERHLYRHRAKQILDSL